jgi:flagellar M-ring protein FliF
MGEYITRVFGQVRDFLGQLSPQKKIAVFATSALVVGGIVAAFMWAGNTTFAPLMSNLTPEDSNKIIRLLREKRIPFRVDPSGKNITVPPENVDQLRLELATSGLPESSVVGYEVFDKTTLGTTSAVQKINQKRALEGELMRTINAIRGVVHSRVHLATPAKSTFVEDQKKPTASVVLDLEPGTVLTDKQIYGIGNLVAKAVEGLDVNDVVIVDSNGKVLSRNSADPLSAATATQLDFQEKVEQDYEKRIENILSRVVGDGHVVAKVSADLDFSQVNETQTTYDADGSAVLSTEKRTDSMNGVRPGPQGVTGAVSNTPGTPPSANGEIRTDTNKDATVINYQVPQTVRHVSHPMGSVKRLSVAVLVDGKTIKSVDKNGVSQSKSEAWSADKLKEFEDLVAGTVGIDKKRGDILEIKNMEFTKEDFDEATRILAERDHKAYVMNLITWSVVGLVIISFFLFVVRPFIKWMTDNTVESVDTFLPQTIEELERMNATASLPGLEDAMPVLPEKTDPVKVEGEMIREKVVTLVDANPHKAALILKDWLHADASKKGAPAAGGKEAAKSATA